MNNQEIDTLTCVIADKDTTNPKIPVRIRTIHTETQNSVWMSVFDQVVAKIILNEGMNPDQIWNLSYATRPYTAQSGEERVGYTVKRAETKSPTPEEVWKVAEVVEEQGEKIKEPSNQPRYLGSSSRGKSPEEQESISRAVAYKEIMAAFRTHEQVKLHTIINELVDIHTKILLGTYVSNADELTDEEFMQEV